MDSDNPVIRLCIAGTQAEFQRDPEQACALYQKAWTLAQNAYEACIAAHYVARCQADDQATLRWNQLALDNANASADERVAAFYPSLWLNMGQSYARLGDLDEAQRYFDLAAALGFPHNMELKE